VLQENAELVKLLAGLSQLDISAKTNGDAARDVPAGAIALVGSGFEAFVFVAEAVDMAVVKAKWQREIDKDGKYIAGLRAKLANKNFVDRAPAELVAEQKRKLADSEARVAKLEGYIRGY
jgi:valyl-tRNA synthetase